MALGYILVPMTDWIRQLLAQHHRASGLTNPEKTAIL